mmetsp:Transcript_21320/g.27537  ORF Transcript_21320/g.27537 Transcript_21320/m.27537 type:complete len:620 (-) Transcript_21320:59-1918(-)
MGKHSSVWLLIHLLLICQRSFSFTLIGGGGCHQQQAGRRSCIHSTLKSQQQYDSNANVNTDANAASSTKNVKDRPEQKQVAVRLPRSERKAAEREGKNRRRNKGSRKHNFSERKAELRGGRKPGEGPLELHSTAMPELNEESTANDVMRVIKRAQNLHDRHDLRAVSRFLLEFTDDSFAYGYKGSLLARLAVAALHMDSHSIASTVIEYRRTNFRSSMLPMESAAIVRNLLRANNVTRAWEILEDELSLPLEGTSLTSSMNRDRLIKRSQAIASVASKHFFDGEPRAAVHACNRLSSLGPILKKSEVTGAELGVHWARLLQGASRCQTLIRNGTITLDGNHPGGDALAEVHLPCNVVYSVLNAMINLPSENDNNAYEVLSNSLVRRVVFVTGAVSMDKCPPPDRGEACFIGRSNVGKSSLVNMVTNRKSLCYISKRPGKTQQFNYFAANDKPGYEKEIRYGDDIPGKKDADSFYIVDLPGFGYAKVPEKQRQEWSSFMTDYISNRRNLRVVFHLVDSRHGPTAEDEIIMKRVKENLPDRARYVIVLTKADKNAKGANDNFTGKVTQSVMDKLRHVMEKNLGPNSDVPVVLTSAETKLGRDEMWRYLCRAATVEKPKINK